MTEMVVLEFSDTGKEKQKVLDEDVIITLRARNPQTARDRVRFSHLEQCFVELRQKESMIDHLNIVSTVVQKTSDEGLFQIQLEASSRGR